MQIAHVNCVFCPVRRMRGVAGAAMLVDARRTVAGWYPEAVGVY
jgi:hypothetical protein